MTNVFDEMGAYWAEIADKSQTEEQLKFLKNHLISNGYILDLACGTGRHSILLTQEDYAVVGMDISANLLKIAKKRLSKLEVVRGDMRFLPFKAQAFQAVVSMDTSFGYLPSEKDDLVVFSEIHRTISQKGVMVVDVFNREELARKYSKEINYSKWKEYPSFFLQQKRTVSQRSDWLCDLWIIRDKASGRLMFFEHSVRLYKKGELQGLVEKAGFLVNQVLGGYEEEAFSVNSSRLILIVRAV
jgi:ubiquinone/menaquinone biosynthesis C-methylase UbiE